MLTSIAKTETIVAVLSFLLLWSVLFPTTVYPNPESQDVVKLEATPNVQWEPGKIKLKVTIQPHRDNIQYCVGYTYSEDPPELQPLRRSCQQLNGIYTPRVYWIEYKGILPGEYFAFAEVIRVPNRLASRVQANFVVMVSAPN